jgi:hypothetical protein
VNKSRLCPYQTDTGKVSPAVRQSGPGQRRYHAFPVDIPSDCTRRVYRKAHSHRARAYARVSTAPDDTFRCPAFFVQINRSFWSKCSVGILDGGEVLNRPLRPLPGKPRLGDASSSPTVSGWAGRCAGLSTTANATRGSTGSVPPAPAAARRRRSGHCGRSRS